MAGVKDGWTRRAALLIGLAALCAAPPAAWADDAVEARPVAPADGVEGGKVGGSGSSLWDWVRTLVALAVVVGLIFAIRWALRRWGAPGAAVRGGPVDILARRSLSAKHQLYLVRMGGRLLLLGGSGESLTTLAEVTDADEIARLVESVERSKAEALTAILGRKRARTAKDDKQ